MRMSCHFITFSEGDIRGGVGGGISYQSDGDARRLAYKGQLQNLVSLRVFGTKIHYHGPLRFLAFI